jgi:hypothetical protein
LSRIRAASALFLATVLQRRLQLPRWHRRGRRLDHAQPPPNRASHGGLNVLQSDGGGCRGPRSIRHGQDQLVSPWFAELDERRCGVPARNSNRVPGRRLPRKGKRAGVGAGRLGRTQIDLARDDLEGIGPRGCATGSGDHNRNGVGRRGGRASRTVVVQHTRRRRACDAGDGAQICIDGLEVILGHAGKRRPRHDLEKTTVGCISG